MNARDEERLSAALDGLLGGAPQGDPAERARLAGELARAGELLRARAFRRPRDEARFVAAVLSRTTREDLSWRGDVRLLVEFLRARLRASPALRLVAASLALHLVAAPALAWWMLHERREERGYTLHVDLPVELPFVEETAPPESPPDELRAAAHAREARANERARTRHGLLARATSLPPLVAAPGSAPVLARLARHVEALRARRAPDGLDLVEGEDLLAHILALELALDRVWLGSQDEDEARRLGWSLARALELPASAPLRVLGASALRRAWSEGLLEVEPAPAAAAFSEAWLAALAESAAPQAEGALAPLATWCRSAQAK